MNTDSFIPGRHIKSVTFAVFKAELPVGVDADIVDKALTEIFYASFLGNKKSFFMVHFIWTTSRSHLILTCCDSAQLIGS